MNQGPAPAPLDERHPEPPSLATMGALVGDPVRAAILLHLSDGTSRPAGELAFLAGASPQAASAHLAQLVAGGLLAVEKQGRHRFFSIASGDVAEMVEQLANWSDARPRRRRLDPDLCRARLCYDHLAGQLGVAVFEWMAGRGWLLVRPDGPALSPEAWAWCREHRVEPDAAPSRRPLLRLCLDWTERKHHLGGRFGACLARALFDQDYLRRRPGGRSIAVTSVGRAFFRQELGIDLAA